MLITERTRQIERFVDWLDNYGETSYDHQTFFAGPLGRRAKSLYYSHHLLGMFAVSPMIFIEAFLPRGRMFFWKKQRFPIADAHYAMGFAYLHRLTQKEVYYDKAVHFLNVLKETRAPNYKNFCWGYPFDWVTRNGTIPANTPFITTTPYVYEAFDAVYQIDTNNEWLEIMHSIAEHCAYDIKDFSISENSTTCSYYPDDEKGGVVNASAYRASMLTMAALRFKNDKYWQIAAGNLNFVLQSQRENGSWYYTIDGTRDFVDHYHTCFVLKALAKIEKLKNHRGCREAIERGVSYYVNELFDINGLPKPFAQAPRLMVYKRELYDCAECINLGTLLKNRNPRLDDRIRVTMDYIFSKWLKSNGSFRSRKLYLGWDNVPMHRWGQSQMFRALCSGLLHEGADKD